VDDDRFIAFEIVARAISSHYSQEHRPLKRERHRLPSFSQYGPALKLTQLPARRGGCQRLGRMWLGAPPATAWGGEVGGVWLHLAARHAIQPRSRNSVLRRRVCDTPSNCFQFKRSQSGAHKPPLRALRSSRNSGAGPVGQLRLTGWRAAKSAMALSSAGACQLESTGAK